MGTNFPPCRERSERLAPQTLRKIKPKGPKTRLIAEGINANLSVAGRDEGGPGAQPLAGCLKGRALQGKKIFANIVQNRRSERPKNVKFGKKVSRHLKRKSENGTILCKDILFEKRTRSQSSYLGPSARK